MIKVVHVMDGLGWAGMEHMVQSLVSNMDKKRFKVYLLSEIPMKDSVRGEVEKLKAHGVEVVFLQTGEARKFLVMDYARLLGRIKPHIVHSHSGVWRDVCLGSVIARVPYIFHTEHGRVFLDDNLRARLTHRFLTRFRTRVIAVSDELKGFLKECVGIGADKLVTIHNGIEVDKFVPRQRDAALREKLGLKNDEAFIMAVGRINPVKDYETLIRAIHEVKNRLRGGARFRLFIAGPETDDNIPGGGLLPRLKALCSALGVQDEVVFLGKRDDVMELLPQADIFVQTSITEGLSMAILEAMSCRLPVVATDVGGNSELVSDGETGMLIKSKDPLAAGDALVRLIRDKGLRAGMGARGRERVVREFSLDHMTEEYQKLYQSAVGGSLR